MKRKASSEMWWIIIAAVMAIIILIVLMMIFTGKTKTVQQGFAECESKGGKCLDLGECEIQQGLVSGAFECSTDQKECCFIYQSKTEANQ